jgi:hypothetical protein
MGIQIFEVKLKRIWEPQILTLCPKKYRIDLEKLLQAARVVLALKRTLLHSRIRCFISSDAVSLIHRRLANI